MFLNNQWVNEKIKKGNRKVSCDKGIWKSKHNFHDAANSDVRGMVMVINICIKKKERSQTS